MLGKLDDVVLQAFHPTIRHWFETRLGAPTPPQVAAWPRIREGRNVLVAAPTGSGKTLTAFLAAIDALLSQGDALPPWTHVLYVSPLKALSNDIAKNLQGPLAELRELDPTLPHVRVAVRTGDTTAAERASMAKNPPHILVTTPESLYLLLTSEGGRKWLRTVRVVIVDEIHALARDKRGSHLALSLERLEALAPGIQRIGLSATQKPLAAIARFLGGGFDGDGLGGPREVEVIDAGHLRKLDLGIEMPPSPLTAVCSHEQWDEIYEIVAQRVNEHRTTLIFVNTRKLAERVSARLAERLGADKVRCHHGSLSKDIRLEAEQQLKSGALKALVATASLELGIDVGDIDLALQLGSPRSIATLLQRMGRAGHGVGRVPKGRLFPLTRDELIECVAILHAVKEGELDRIAIPRKPLDVLAQQLVASCVAGEWSEDELFARFRRAEPYHTLERTEFDAVVKLLSESMGRSALLHRDGVNGRLMATRRARMRALSNGGVIPDLGDYRVLLEPEGTYVGSVTEDFAIESNRGDIFQLGSTSWRVLRVEPGILRVADAGGAPPTIPFWIGEAPGRTVELSRYVGKLREEFESADQLMREYALDVEPARQIADYLGESKAMLGALPSQTRLIAERFFDETGGTQIVLHAPFGGRINRALGYALRKRICVGFGFELQAAATDDSIVFSLGEKPGVPVDEIFEFLQPETFLDVLIQAILRQPMFENRFRWNATRSLLVERMNGGKHVPLVLQRMRATDVLGQAFPDIVACPETLVAPKIEVPHDHPLVKQTIADCLFEACDVEGAREVLLGLRSGAIARHAVDTAAPSPLSHEVLAARPYAFLDDAPLEERRTRAVMTRRILDPATAEKLGSLDPEAIARVKDEVWPQPRSKEEVHEVLTWMGYVTIDEAPDWSLWLELLEAEGRVVRDGDRFRAIEATTDPKAQLRGRMEVLGPVFEFDADTESLLRQLEADGAVFRIRHEGKTGYCDRRLMQRIQNYTLDRLRKEIEPVSAADFVRFLSCWQHVDPDYQREGPRGVVEVLTQLAGYEAPARAWEQHILPARVKGYRREWLDQATLSGEIAFGRLFSAGNAAIKAMPLAFVPRSEMSAWLAYTSAPDLDALSGDARAALELLAARGAMFPDDLQRRLNLLPAYYERAIQDLLGHGAITSDSFATVRSLLVPPSERAQMFAVGRFSPFRSSGELRGEPDVEFIAKRLLDRTGVVFRKTLENERIPIFWRDLLRCYRRMELRGEVRGGRFVTGFDGEQYALPAAVTMLRAVRRRGDVRLPQVSDADPLNVAGVLLPEAGEAAGVPVRADREAESLRSG